MQNLAASHSFTQFETPGWSSIVHTELSQKFTGSNQLTGGLSSDKILERLNRMKGVDIEESRFQKIKLKEDDGIIVFGKQNSTHFTHQKYNQTEKDQRQECKKINTKERITSSKITQGNTNRPKHLTIHQTLYLESRKLQSKRLMQQILNQQMEKKEVTPFHPRVGEMSRKLAEQKWSRIKERGDQQLKLQIQMEEKSRKKTAKSTSQLAHNNSAKQLKQKDRLNTLSSLFMLLSNCTQLISPQSLTTQTLEELPLPLLSHLQPILNKVYKGGSYDWLQFLDAWNRKGKESIEVVLGKWMQRKQKKQEKIVQSQYIRV